MYLINAFENASEILPKETKLVNVTANTNSMFLSKSSDASNFKD